MRLDRIYLSVLLSASSAMSHKGPPHMSTPMLIKDRDAHHHILSTLIRNGYHPSLTWPTATSGTKKLDSSSPWFGPSAGMTGRDYRGELFTEQQVLDLAASRPYCGIGVTCWTQNKADDLLIIDVDVDDQEVINTIALIIQTPCPVRVGSKGAAFIVRCKNAKLKEIVESRGLPNEKTCTNDKVFLSHLTRLERGRGHIDLITSVSTSRHAVIPPTLHLKATLDRGEDVHYKWIPFPLPGYTEVHTLLDMPYDELPVMSEAQMLMIYQYAKNNQSPIWRFLGHLDEEALHQLLLHAPMYMSHEMFTDEEIIDILMWEIERVSPDPKDLKRRETEFLRSIKDMPRKIKEKNPAKESKKSRDPKTPEDRKVYDWLIDRYASDDCMTFGITHHSWENNRWTPIVDLAEQNPARMLWEMARENFAEASTGAIDVGVKSFLKNFKRYRRVDTYESKRRERMMIAFENGLLDLETMKIRDEVRDDYIDSRVLYNFNPDAKCPLWDAFIKDLMTVPQEIREKCESDEEAVSERDKAIRTLEAFFGYCLTTSHFTQSMLFLIGKSGVGKSELFKTLKGVVPSAWVSTISMEDMDKPNSRRDMVLSRFNVSDEVGRRDKRIESMLLKVTSGEPIEVKTLYEDVQSISLQARMIFHGNAMPDMDDQHAAIQRRIIVLRTTDRKPTAGIPDIHTKLMLEAEGILARWVDAYREVAIKESIYKDDSWFDLPDYSRSLAKEVSTANNSVAIWMNELTEKVDDPKDGTSNFELYENYSEYCKHYNFKPFSVVGWAKVLSNIGITCKQIKIHGKNTRMQPLRLVNSFKQAAGY